MSEAQANEEVRSSPQSHDPSEGRIAKLVYLLYLFSGVHAVSVMLYTYGFGDYNADFINSQAMIFYTLVEIAGVVIAYQFSDTKYGWVSGHLRYQIRTFWISTLFGIFLVIPFALLPGDETIEEASIEELIAQLSSIAGVLVIGALFVGWWLVRNIGGYKRVVRGQPIPNPKSWFFGG